MVRSESMSIEEMVPRVVTLDARRARLRRRRRRDALREWASLAVIATVGTWLAAAAIVTLVAR
jgi:hypothetical protein